MPSSRLRIGSQSSAQALIARDGHALSRAPPTDGRTKIRLPKRVHAALVAAMIKLFNEQKINERTGERKIYRRGLEAS
jgi:hypothetical protein